VFGHPASEFLDDVDAFAPARDRVTTRSQASNLMRGVLYCLRRRLQHHKGGCRVLPLRPPASGGRRGNCLQPPLTVTVWNECVRGQEKEEVAEATPRGLRPHRRPAVREVACSLGRRDDGGSRLDRRHLGLASVVRRVGRRAPTGVLSTTVEHLSVGPAGLVTVPESAGRTRPRRERAAAADDSSWQLRYRNARLPSTAAIWDERATK